jgi:hypothetical protein
MKAWLLWFLLCGIAQASLAAITGGVALHSPAYGPRSVGMGAAILGGIELAITGLFVANEWYREAEKTS